MRISLRAAVNKLQQLAPNTPGRRVILALLAVLLLIAPTPAEAQVIDTIYSLLSGIFLAIANLLGRVLITVIDILMGVVQFNNFIDAPAVATGWYLVRDICNMFFIVVLLIIAFSTILRIDRYRYERLLPKLIIMAVLVNFSKMIAGFFIDFSQVVTLTFVNAFKDAAAGNFTQAFGLRDMLAFRSGTDDAPGTWQYLGATILAVALILIAVVVMLAMLLVFIVRIIFLWILVVLSPLAYLLSTMPGGAQQYASKWWSQFGKWVTVGPILAFFIWLSLTILASPSFTTDSGLDIASTGEKGIEVGDEGVISASISKISESQNLLSFIIAIALMVMALLTAQQMGGVAGGFAKNALGKIQGMGTAALKVASAPMAGAYRAARFGVEKGAGWIGKGLDVQQMKLQEKVGLKTPISLRPSVIKEAFGSWRTQREREKYDVARGSTQDAFHRVFSGQRTDYAQRAKRRLEHDEETKILSNTGKELEHGFLVAQEKRNKPRMAAYLRKLANQGDLDDAVRDLGYKTSIDGSANDFHAFLENELIKKGGYDPQDAYRVGDDIGRLAEANGQYGLARSLGYNISTGKFEKLSPEEWASVVSSQQSKRDPQVIARNNHRTAYVSETRVWQKLDGTIVVKPEEIQDDLDQLVQRKNAAATKEEKDLIDQQMRKVREGFLADLGFHKAGELTFAGMDPSHANRVNPNAAASIMFNNAEAARNINPGMYKAMWQQLMMLNQEQLAKIENNAFSVVREEGGRLVQKEHAKLKSAALGVAWEELSDRSGLKEKVIQEAASAGIAKDDKDAFRDYYNRNYLV